MRNMLFYKELKAKRQKKIKSKSYRRIKKKEKEKLKALEEVRSFFGCFDSQLQSNHRSSL